MVDRDDIPHLLAIDADPGPPSATRAKLLGRYAMDRLRHGAARGC